MGPNASQQALAAYAVSREWRFAPDGTGLEKWFTGPPFGRGSYRRSSNVVEGSYEGRVFIAFDYRFTTGSGDHDTVHRTSITSMKLGTLAQPVPMLHVEPQGAINRFFSGIAGSDFQLGDPVFDKAFLIRTDNPELAHDVLHPAMREMLFPVRDRAWRLRGDSLLMFRRGSHTPADLDGLLASMKAVLDQVPPHVWDRLRGGETPR